MRSVPTPEAVTLSWTDNSDDEEGFTIWRAATKIGPYQVLAIVGPDETTFSLNNDLDLSRAHFFRISAWNERGESRPSNTVSTLTILLNVLM